MNGREVNGGSSSLAQKERRDRAVVKEEWGIKESLFLFLFFLRWKQVLYLPGGSLREISNWRERG